MSRLPAIFFGHGNPMNALAANAYTQAWAKIGQKIGTPRAIVMVSAHWYVRETAVTAMTSPRTIHDFGGFPDALYRAQYAAPGDPALAQQLRQLLAPVDVRLDQDWGLDHGTWSVLCHAWPKADVPVIQLSMDATKSAAFHYELGKKLAPLRDDNVLVAASGNLVHNLRACDWAQARGPYDWAVRFEQQARALMQAGDDAALIDYQALGPDAALSVPTPEHFLPLLYILGARQPGEALSFPTEGMEGGSISMLAVRAG